MAEQELSQAQVWDDSELVDSWNEAFEEYKKYHSLAAKGEKVQINSMKLQQGLTNGDRNPDDTEQLPAVEQPAFAGSNVKKSVDEQVSGGAQPTVSVGPAPSIPQALAATVQNEDLKNIMMSWYYAGYYTGLYEGKQQGHAGATQQHV